MVSYALRRLIHPLDDGGVDLGLDEFSAEAGAKRHGGTKIGDDGRESKLEGTQQPLRHDAAGTIRCPEAVVLER